MPAVSPPSIVTRPARLWWMGPALALVGFCALAGGAAWALAQHTELTQARVAAQGVRAATADARAALVALAAGQDAADQLAAARTRIQADVNALDRGGYAEQGLGRQTVPASADRPLATRLLLGTTAAPVDRVLGSLADHAAALAQAAQADARISGDLTALVQASSAVQASSFGPRYADAWAALLPLASSDSLGGMALAVSAPLSALQATASAPPDAAPSPVQTAHETLLTQWRAVLVKNASLAQAVADQANSDSSLSSTQRQQAQRVAQAWSVLRADIQAASGAPAARAAAVRAWGDAQAPLAQLDTAATLLDSSLFTASTDWGTPARLLAIIGAVLTLLGSLWSLAGLVRATDAYWRAEREHMSGGQAQQALLRVTSAVRRILNREGRSTRLAEDPQSPSYALSSLVNQMLVQRDEAVSLLIEQHGILSAAALAADSEASRGSTFQIQLAAAWDAWSAAKAALLAATAHERAAHDRLPQVRAALGDARARLDGLITAMGWTSNELREQTQGIAKRIKRQGEDAQALNTTAESVVDTNKKVRVLALNLAVAAAAQGDAGRPMASLANELERLADEVSSAMGDMAARVEDLQENVRDAASGSERNTACLVELAEPLGSIHQTLGQTQAALSDWDAADQDAGAAAELAGQNDEAAEAALAEVRGALDRTAALVASVRTHAAQIHEVSLSISRWLSRYGFNS